MRTVITRAAVDEDSTVRRTLHADAADAPLRERVCRRLHEASLARAKLSLAIKVDLVHLHNGNSQPPGIHHPYSPGDTHGVCMGYAWDTVRRVGAQRPSELAYTKFTKLIIAPLEQRE